ncbi:natural killer cell receptor 2B4 [Sinocyclocheilus anshuiensis]|uniref:natural killer cell receptor 2B4 n=1 Tax=Sinocyclocheilus anshuiensis TaxID=1608454 RepID=UPI0007BAB07B|nr:PREDICTED: natural killer cell receptor 2B4-like [Sinocyclocheilus anshuiensis]
MALTRLQLTFIVAIIGPLSSSTVSSDQPITKKVMKGKSVELETQNNLSFDHFEWIKDKSEIVVTYDSKTGNTESSHERVDFNKQTLSLTIKNTQETDSGLYTARASGESDTTISLYNVIVVSSDQPIPKKVMKGKSVELETQNNLSFDHFEWIKDKSEIVVTYDSKTGNTESSHERVDFNKQTLSLTIKNTQETDSGLYTARASGESDTTISLYNVIVVGTSSQASTTESVSLTWIIFLFPFGAIMVLQIIKRCSGHDRTIREIHHSNNCTQENVKSFGIQTLALYCIENVVVCNYSNPVSWKNDTIKINQLCTPHEQENPEENISFPLHWLLVIAGVSVLVFTAVSVICCSYKKRKKSAQQNDPTVYAQVQPRNEVQRPLEMLEKSANPQTVYGFTGEHKQTHNTSQTMPSLQIQEAQTENRPSTAYSTIGQHQKPSSASETDHTIYSTVCKSTQGRQPVHK